MELSARVLNRTLLARQHLLARADLTVPAMVEHLVGLQAQDPLPPYLGLAARLETFDPYDVTRGLEDRSLVRMLTLRSTVHLLTTEDALSLRHFTRPIHEQERKVSQNVAASRHLDDEELVVALRRVLAGGPLPVKQLGEALTATWPDVPPHALGSLARVVAPLAQLPPRGTWKRSGGVLYDFVDTWVGGPLAEPDVETIVRRYLAAYGPASAADVTAWSGVRGMPAVLAGMDNLVRHTDEAGKKLFDLPDAEVVDADTPAPVRLLGLYDNVWLSHAGRDRVTTPEKRKRWMGTNGGLSSTVFVDGWLEGLWRVEDGRPVVVDLFRPLTRTEKAGLDEELERAAALLAR